MPKEADPHSLITRALGSGSGNNFLQNNKSQAFLSELRDGSSLSCDIRDLENRSVLIAATDQLTAALALLELDGIAGRLILAPPDMPAAVLKSAIAEAGVDAILSERPLQEELNRPHIRCGPEITKGKVRREPCCETEWILFTSGTMGRPKMAVHTLSTLSGAIASAGGRSDALWATFYDIRRYGGLQIFLRAALGGASLLLTRHDEPVSESLEWLGEQRVTHLTGTPTHWRRVLMSSAARKINPHYVRLSGEIADQSILDALRALYPDARIVHAYAATEAGVGFEVDDEKEGFPASYIGSRRGDVELEVRDGSLRVRSSRSAKRYLSTGSFPIVQDDGFVDTGDVVALRGDRYHFIGRKDGAVKIGGEKVHPEEVEAVINRHAAVHGSLVSAKKSPITGAVLIAEVVRKSAPHEADNSSNETLEKEIRVLCARHLDRHKVPAIIRVVAAFGVTASGKLARKSA